DAVPTEHRAVVCPVVRGQSGERRADRVGGGEFVQPACSDGAAMCQIQRDENTVDIAATQDTVRGFRVAVNVELRGSCHVTACQRPAHDDDACDFVPESGVCGK